MIEGLRRVSGVETIGFSMGDVHNAHKAVEGASGISEPGTDKSIERDLSRSGF
jgi:hypothetical protein